MLFCNCDAKYYPKSPQAPASAPALVLLVERTTGDKVS